MEFNNIIYSVKENIATIKLNTPDNLNAFNEQMIMDVLDALKIAEDDDFAKAVVISAEGKSFSGGGDINEMVEGIKVDKIVFEETVRPIAQISYNIKKMSKPVIASVFGAVAGAAFNIALACDFCIAADNTKFIQAFAKIGLIPDAGGLYLLTRAVGVNKATQLAMLGLPVSAEEGQSLGFVYQVCELKELDQTTNLLAEKLVNGPSKAYAYIKELIFTSQFEDYEKYTDLEVEKQIACGHTQDFREGITAFKEKRTPKFTGK